MTNGANPLRLGLIGAGIFARDAHVPALLALGDVVVIGAIWSRTRENAAALAASIGERTGVAPEVVDDLDALLARPDLDAVDIILPIDTQPDIVRKAWAAGKHVISEKPVAATVTEGRKLIADYRAQYAEAGIQWMVAENWRYESAFVAAREVVTSGALGKIITVSWTLHMPTTPSLPYFHTAWRKSGRIPGGYLLDAGVHHAAVLRALVGEVQSVRAFVVQNNPQIPPADTIAAALHFENGAVGTYVASYADTPATASPLLIVGTKALLRVGRGYVEIERGGEVERRETARVDGVKNELAAFIAAVCGGVAHINTPEEALRDVAIIEALLTSGAAGRPANVAV